MSFRIEPYGILLFVSIHVGVLLTEWRLRKNGESLLARPWVIIAAAIGALAGGRVHFLIEGLLRGSLDVAEVPAKLSPFVGGSTFFGAMAGLMVVLVLSRRRLPGGSVLRLLDAAVLGLAVAIAIGRTGCFVEGCCLGAPTDLPWGIGAGRYAAEPEVRALVLGPFEGARVAGSPALHPLVAYLGLLALGSALLAISGPVPGLVGTRVGQAFFSFVFFFSLGRFLLEPLRLPPPGGISAVNPARWEALGLAVCAAILIAVRRRVRPFRTSG